MSVSARPTGRALKSVTTRSGNGTVARDIALNSGSSSDIPTVGSCPVRDKEDNSEEGRESAWIGSVASLWSIRTTGGESDDGMIETLLKISGGEMIPGTVTEDNPSSCISSKAAIDFTFSLLVSNSGVPSEFSQEFIDIST